MKLNQLKQLEDAGLSRIPVQEIRGRELICPNQTFIDFAGTNYLGFDFNPYLFEKGNEFARKWTSLCGWSRLEADPEIYRQLEERICRFTGASDALLSHTITLTNFSVLPRLSSGGIIFADEKVHTVVWEACRLARDHGAKLEKFRHQDVAHLEQLLQQYKDVHPKLIAVDGVYSISTELAPISELNSLCHKYQAWLYVDDAHGFGILGSKPDANNPYGYGGTGIVSHFNTNYDRIFYVSNFGKAFCVNAAFVTIPNEYKDNLPAYSLSHIFSAPPSPHTIGMVEAALDLNESIGDQERLKISNLTRYFCEEIKKLGFHFENHLNQPVVFISIGDIDELIVAANRLKDAGILTGLRAYPIVPKNQCGVRFAFTATHTKAQLDRALDVLSGIKKKSAIAVNELATAI